MLDTNEIELLCMQEVHLQMLIGGRRTRFTYPKNSTQSSVLDDGPARQLECQLEFILTTLHDNPALPGIHGLH